MSESPSESFAAPIVEAVLDLDCDMPPNLDLAALQAPANQAFGSQYSKSRVRPVQEHMIAAPPDTSPTGSSRKGVQALQFLQEDERQLVQVRARGFSFNRLAPYASFDEYLPEIERTWRLFVKLASPLQIRLIRLRYINRIVLPPSEARVELGEYFNVAPPVPGENRLTSVSFLNQHTAIETSTGNQTNVIITNQIAEKAGLPIILDIEVVNGGALEPDDWAAILDRIRSLRSLKNWVFHNTLKERCLSLFRR